MLIIQRKKKGPAILTRWYKKKKKEETIRSLWWNVWVFYIKSRKNYRSKHLRIFSFVWKKCRLCVGKKKSMLSCTWGSCSFVVAFRWIEMLNDFFGWLKCHIFRIQMSRDCCKVHPVFEEFFLSNIKQCKGTIFWRIYTTGHCQ